MRYWKATRATIERDWLPRVRYVFITWGDRETDIVDDETGLVIWTAPSVPRALENAIAFARVHRFTLRRVDIPREDA